MESKAKLFGHPIHQMLIVFPLGLLATSVVFDLVHLLAPAALGDDAARTSYRLISAGLIGGLLAALFGVVDWMAIPGGTRAKRIGGLHGGSNMLVVALFTVSWWLRRDSVDQPSVAALAASFAGAGISLFTARLGGELVNRLGVGVSPNAHLDARSSLDGPEPRGTAAQVERNLCTGAWADSTNDVTYRSTAK